jgi:hypothetical protein
MVKIIFHGILIYTTENTASYCMDSSATPLQKPQNSQNEHQYGRNTNYHNVQCNTHLQLGPFITGNWILQKKLKGDR